MGAGCKMREQAERKYKAMVGQRYGRLTVIEYQGRDELSGRQGSYKIVCRCDCGDEWVYEAWKVLKGRRTMCSYCARQEGIKSGHGQKGLWTRDDTLCWTCKKATNRKQCCWAGGKPRKDWDAEPTVIRGGNNAEKSVHSYRVKSCPGYEEG